MAKKHVQVMEDVLAGRMEALPDEPDTLDGAPVDDSAAGGDAEPPPAPEGAAPSLAAPEDQGTEPTPPKLDLKLDAEETHEPETPDAEPEWLAKSPEDVQKYVRELRSAREGQRHAYARRAEQVKTLQERLTKAELERRQAIHLALEGRKAQVDPPTAAAAPPKEAPRKGIPVTIDENTGEASVDPAVLERLVDERARQIVGQQAGQQGAESVRVSTVDRMVSDAGITQQTQEALFYAAQDTLELVRQAAALEGREVRGVADAKVLLRKHGAEPILQRKYPGLTIHDVYDVIEGSSDPDGHGHRLVEVAQRAQSRWFGQAPAQNGTPAPRQPGPPKTPRPIGDHPASMASRGPGTNPTNARSRATLDEIVAMNDMDTVLNMDQKEKDELWRRWDAEMGETPAGFSR